MTPTTTAFVQPRSRPDGGNLVWSPFRTGCRAGKLGVDRALAFSEINQQLFQLLNGLDVVYHAQGEYAYADEIVLAALEKLRKGSRQNLTAPATMTDWRPIVHEMRLFKSPEEIAVLRRAGKLARWRISARWKNAVRGCLSISWRGNSPRI